ncbi:MAG: replication factor C large subunit [Candidatus Hodarchaeales archaeon]|jgi:replication factor C large subunit
MLPWVQKYSPNRLVDVKGNPKPLQIIESWLDSYPNVREKALLLAGPPGTGKTSSVYAYAKEKSFEVVEYNASDTRNKNAVETDFYRALTEMSLVTLDKRKIVLLDEVDGMSGTQDRGGIAALLKMLGKSAFPVIMICNDLQNKRVASLKNKKSLIKIVKFNRLRQTTMVTVLRSILASEVIGYDPGVLKIIVEESGGDMRGAINDLENLSYGQNHISSTDLSVLKKRDRLIDKYEGIQRIFKSKTPLDAHAVTSNLDLNFEFLLMWVYQNAYKWAGTPAELSEMYHYIALANLYRSRIYRNQYWKLLKYYFFFLSAGVNYAKKTPYSFKRIDWPLWGRVKRPPEEVRADYRRIASRNKLSMNKFSEVMLPYLKIIFNNNTGKSYLLAQEYSLCKETVSELAGDNFDLYKKHEGFVEFWKALKQRTTVQEKRKIKVKTSPRKKKKKKDTTKESPKRSKRTVTTPSKGEKKPVKIASSTKKARITRGVEVPAEKTQIGKQVENKTEKTPVVGEVKPEKKKKKEIKAKSTSLSDFFKT